MTDLVWQPSDQASISLYATDETNRYFTVEGIEPNEVVPGLNAFTRSEWELVFIEFKDI